MVDIELLSSDYHEEPEKTHKLLQQKILEISIKDYDYILLGYGLCGKVLNGLSCGQVPLIVLRAHDCTTLFLGDKDKYDKLFTQNPGTIYYPDLWIERRGIASERREVAILGLDKSYEYYVEKYGEEGARYILEIADSWQENYNQAIYIETGLEHEDYSLQVKALAQQRHWTFKKIKGDLSLIRKLVNGLWSEDDFLEIHAGEHISQSGMKNIIVAKKDL